MQAVAAEFSGCAEKFYCFLERRVLIAKVGTRSRAIRRGTSRRSFSASPVGAHACTVDMVFVRVYGRATPDRAGARPYHGDRPYTLC